MAWVFAIIGGVLGLVVTANSSQLLGPVIGVVLGILVAEFVQLRRRVDELEEAARQPRHDARTVISPPPIRPPAPSPAPPAPAGGQAPTVARAPAWAAAAPVTSPSPAQAIPRIPAPPPENRLDVAFRLARQWLTTGNVPVKIGVIVSFFGVAFLLKYAVDRRLFAFPIELRLLLVAAAAVVLLVVGWRLRARARTYALSVQGAGLGILYMTTFAAYRLYGLIP